MLLHDLVTSAAATDPDRPAVIGPPDGAATSFAQFDRQIRSVAGWVATHREPGDRIAVVADNSTAYARLYYACHTQAAC